jgi:Na+-driven multidrug efflux pump
MRRLDLSGRDLVMFALALGLLVAIDSITVGILWDAIASKGPGISDNAAQILTTAFGGIIGVLGSYVGYRQGAADRTERDNATNQRTDTATNTDDTHTRPNT